MSDFVNSVIAQAIREKINLLEDQNIQRKHDIKTAETSMEENAEKLQRIVEDIEALRRYYIDVRERITFNVDQNKNAEWVISENKRAIAELKAELSKHTKPAPAPAPAPAKTRSGNLTVDTEKIIRKQFAPLLTLEGKRLDEYVVEIRTQGYDYHDTAISTALGKKSYWLATLVQNAKQAGYRVPRNKKF